MKIIVVSDSHGNYEKLNEIYLSHQDVDLFWHLGDFEIPEYLLSPYMAIKGNCDYFSNLPNEKDLIINTVKFHLEHGQFINFNNLESYVTSKNCDIFLFGHLHKKIELKIDNTLILNPGSLTKPRDSNIGSYLLIEFTNKDDLKYKFINLE